MSAADVMPGLSLPEIHPTYSSIPAGFDLDTSVKPDWDKLIGDLNLNLAAEDSVPTRDISNPFLDSLRTNYRPGRSGGDPMNKLIEGFKEKADAGLFEGKEQLWDAAVAKTIASADQLFTALIGITAGRQNINKAYGNQRQAYTNQMNALDNQVLHIKNQMMDRFNKTVATNVVAMAARNLRVTTGGVLEHTKDAAQEITEDFRMAESNAELKKISLKAANSQAKLQRDYNKTNQWFQLAEGAAKLGMAVATGGGTGEEWGSLYAGHKQYKAYKKGQSLADTVY